MTEERMARLEFVRKSGEPDFLRELLQFNGAAPDGVRGRGALRVVTSAAQTGKQPWAARRLPQGNQVGSLDLAALGPGGGVCEAVVYQPVPGFLPRVGVRQFSGLYRLAALILAEH
jgi:hypothetical protein